MIDKKATTVIAKTLLFKKESGIWYADLPEFLEQGLGTKANLMMVDGSDTFLDRLSSEAPNISLKISTTAFEGYEGILLKEAIGLNTVLLDSIGHAPVSYGAYYNVTFLKGNPYQHRLWLCPVTEYFFEGDYPDEIYISALT